MSAAPLHFGTERVMLDPAGVLIWPAARLLVVADLHLEKASHFARRGRLLPPYDSRDTLRRLQPLLRHWGIRRLIALGDSFHDAEGALRLLPEDTQLLVQMLDGLEMIWVLGNHDPVPPAGLPGQAVVEWRQGPFRFRHEATPPPQPGRFVAMAAAGVEISGHFHPVARIPTRAGTICRPCFVADSKRVILPAFGSLTGGLNAMDPAVANHFPRGGRLFLLGSQRLTSMPFAPRRGPRRPAEPGASGAAQDAAHGSTPGQMDAHEADAPHDAPVGDRKAAMNDALFPAPVLTRFGR